jgi:hypothetical protein
MLEAAEILGCWERRFWRYRARYGRDWLTVGRASFSQAGCRSIGSRGCLRSAGRTTWAGPLGTSTSICNNGTACLGPWPYLDQTQLHAAGLVERAPRRGRPGGGDGRRHQRGLFGLSGGGGRYRNELPGAANRPEHARSQAAPARPTDLGEPILATAPARLRQTLSGKHLKQRGQGPPYEDLVRQIATYRVALDKRLRNRLVKKIRWVRAMLTVSYT